MESCTVRNQILLRGQLQNLPEFSHENHGKRFFRFFLEIARLSGAVDTLPVIAEEGILNQIDLSGGDMINVVGQVRSHNIRESGKRHLLLFVFASAITAESGEPLNHVTLDAIICRTPTLRRTPLGREICDLMLAVPRPFHRTDYIPCILWGKLADTAAECEIGSRILVYGRMQSRIYSKITESGVEEHTAYEVSALSAELLPTFPE